MKRYAIIYKKAPSKGYLKDISAWENDTIIKENVFDMRHYSPSKLEFSKTLSYAKIFVTKKEER